VKGGWQTDMARSSLRLPAVCDRTVGEEELRDMVRSSVPGLLHAPRAARARRSGPARPYLRDVSGLA
jgi:hypothetical protein